MNNNLYNRFYKLSCAQNSMWNNMLDDAKWMDGNIFGLFEGRKGSDSAVKMINRESVDSGVKTKGGVSGAKMWSKNIADIVEGFQEGDLSVLLSTKSNDKNEPLKGKRNFKTITNESEKGTEAKKKEKR